jgi:hypothetical protein
MTGGVRLFRLTSACSRREQDFSLAICKKQRPGHLDKQTDLIIKDDNVLVDCARTGIDGNNSLAPRGFICPTLVSPSVRKTFIVKPETFVSPYGR